MSKKLLIAVICLIIALLTLKKENRTLGDAEAVLISHMLENERAVEVFSMEDGVIST